MGLKSVILISMYFYSAGLFLQGVTANNEESVFLDFPNSGNRVARMALGTKVGWAKCGHIGKTCFVQRNKKDSPSKVEYGPCCQHLTCQGLGPQELRNGFGQAHSSSDLLFTGICTVSLDNGGGDFQAYKDYVAGL